jgi:hypothetical protein
LDLVSYSYDDNQRNPVGSCLNDKGIPVFYHRWDIDWKPQVWFHKGGPVIYFDCTDNGGIRLPENWI